MLLTVIEVHLIVIHTSENKKSDRFKKGYHILSHMHVNDFRVVAVD